MVTLIGLKSNQVSFQCIIQWQGVLVGLCNCTEWEEEGSHLSGNVLQCLPTSLACDPFRRLCVVSSFTKEPFCPLNILDGFI